MTIDADWQAELRGVTFGADTRYILTGPIGGLGIPAPRGADQERGNQPGHVAGYDIANRRTITMPIGIDGTNADDAWTLYETLKAAWTSTVVDVALDLRLPGFASLARRFYGRPRGLDVELTLMRSGWIDALGTFDALDPFAYGPELEEPLTDGVTDITNPGHAATDRYTVTLTATDSPVTFANAADLEPDLTLTDLTGTVILNGRNRTVTDGDGDDLYGHLAAGSGWPILAPGSNAITLTGATGTVTYRPAYL